MIYVAILIGYLLGSLSPAYILGRLLKQIDIRQVGEKNAGTTNVYKVLGLWPAVITAIYDISKGLLAMLIAYWLKIPQFYIYLSGLAAVVGHIFPFYLKWRGGQGAATCVGLLFYFLYQLLKQHFLPLNVIALLTVETLALLIITKQKKFLALVILPALGLIVFKNYTLNLIQFFTLIIIVYLFCLNIFLAYREKLFVLKEDTIEKIRPWRTVLRPLAAVFPLALFYFDRNLILWVLGIISVIPILLDLIRLSSQKINLFLFRPVVKIFKKREQHRFSSISLFLLSSFIVVLIFPKSIAIATLFFMIFGDVFAKFFGSEYGKIKLFGEKTLEGSVAHLMACLLVAYILWPHLDLSPYILLTGVISATIAEALPLGINDNFSVSLIAASSMFIGVKFF